MCVFVCVRPVVVRDHFYSLIGEWRSPALFTKFRSSIYDFSAAARQIKQHSQIRAHLHKSNRYRSEILLATASGLTSTRLAIILSAIIMCCDFRVPPIKH